MRLVGLRRPHHGPKVTKAGTVGIRRHAKRVSLKVKPRYANHVKARKRLPVRERVKAHHKGPRTVYKKLRIVRFS